MVSLKLTSPQKERRITRQLMGSRSVTTFLQESGAAILGIFVAFVNARLGQSLSMKSLPERLFARRGEVDHARALRASRPAELEASIEQDSAERAGEVVTAHAPVQTGATQRATSAHQRFDVDTDPGKESLPVAGELQSVTAGSQKVPLLEAIEDKHAQFAGKMVVAHAGLSERRLARTRTKTHRASSIGHAH